MKKLIMQTLVTSFLLAILFSTTASAAGGFKIDGYFDDWENVKKTNISYNSWDGRENHSGAIVVHDGYLYGYFELSRLYSSQITPHTYYIKVNGQQSVINFQYTDSNGNVDWNKNMYNLDNGIHRGISAIAGNYPLYNVGDAAFHIVYRNNTSQIGDRLEFRVKLSELEKAMNLPEGSMSHGAKIELYNPNIGKESLIVVGTSSGAFMGIGLSLLAVFGITAKRRKKERA